MSERQNADSARVLVRRDIHGPSWLYVDYFADGTWETRRLDRPDVVADRGVWDREVDAHIDCSGAQ